MNNTVYGDNYGNVGGSGNVVINYLASEWNLFEGTRRGFQELPEVQKNLLLLEMINTFGERIVNDVGYGLNHKINPIKIDMTEEIDFCARSMYQNNVMNSDYVYDFIKGFFSALMQLNRWVFEVEPVRVGRHIYFELSY